jgi:hypothetical protein
MQYFHSTSLVQGESHGKLAETSKFQPSAGQLVTMFGSKRRQPKAVLWLERCNDWTSYSIKVKNFWM